MTDPQSRKKAAFAFFSNLEHQADTQAKPRGPPPPLIDILADDKPREQPPASVQQEPVKSKPVPAPKPTTVTTPSQASGGPPKVAPKPTTAFNHQPTQPADSKAPTTPPKPGPPAIPRRPSSVIVTSATNNGPPPIAPKPSSSGKRSVANGAAAVKQAHQRPTSTPVALVPVRGTSPPPADAETYNYSPAPKSRASSMAIPRPPAAIPRNSNPVPLPPSSYGETRSSQGIPSTPSRAAALQGPAHERAKSLPAAGVVADASQESSDSVSSSPSSVRKFKAVTLTRYDQVKDPDAGKAVEANLEKSNVLQKLDSPNVKRGSIVVKQALEVSTNKLISEIVVTERDYVDDLKVIVELFLHPLRHEKSLTDADLFGLFANVEELYPVNQKLLGQFLALKDPSPGQIAECFESLIEEFHPYTQFCARQDVFLATFMRLKENNSLFQTFLEYNKYRPECRGLNIDAFIIKPVQRICKYPLLLRELLKQCEEGTLEYDQVKLVQESIERILIDINTAKGELDKLRDLDEKLSKHSKDVKELKLSLARKPRRIIAEGQLDFLKEPKKMGQPYDRKPGGYFYLLSDYFIYLKKQSPIKVSKIIPLDSVVTQQVPMPDFPGAFEIFDHAAGTRTTFCAADGLVTTSIFTALSERIDLYQAMNSLSN